MQLTKI